MKSYISRKLPVATRMTALIFAVPYESVTSALNSFASSRGCPAFQTLGPVAPMSASTSASGLSSETRKADKAYDRDMTTVHMTEAEVAANFAAVLEKVRQGAEIVVE